MSSTPTTAIEKLLNLTYYQFLPLENQIRGILLDHSGILREMKNHQTLGMVSDMLATQTHLKKTFKVLFPKRDEWVAVKVMDINQIKEDYVIKNLCREAKIMSKLNHPCIVALFQTMQRSDNVYYLVTELVSGGDLCSFVKSQHYGKLEERPTRIYARQFASALSHMHGLGIVHRDLKMENVMLNSSQSQIKIVDFGLSNLWSPDNPLRTHCGSPEYAAPELFITGKQYGAEVDLWSLGIILYGMVLGQLPFVTARGSTATSQERRKKLVAQINRGLSTHHRRALAPFSPEFRGLMSRLLVSDAAKRITVKELTAHAWITERGRRLVRSWPLKEVDANWRNKMIFEIASLLQIEKKLVLSALSQDPLGKIGGMYNILQRRYQMSQLHGDGVTRSVPSVTLLELSDMTKGVGKERAILSSRSPAQKKPQTAAVGRRTDYYCTPRMVDLNKHLRQVISSPNENVMRNKLSQTKPRKKEPQPQPQLLPPKQRPCTVQPTPSTAAPEKRRPLPDCRLLPDYRTIQSPNLRRKAYSATVTPKTNRPFSPPPTREGKRSLEAERARVEAGRARVEAGDGPRGGGEKGGAAGGGRSVATQHCCSDEQQRKFIRALPEQTRCRSEQSHHRKRPVTGPLQQFFERSLKTAGVTVTRSVSKTTEKHRQGNAKSTQIRKREDSCWEACGGDSTRAVTAVPYPPGRKPAIYDPIARSIADYVVNNVPHKLPSVQELKRMYRLLRTRTMRAPSSLCQHDRSARR